MTKRKSKRSFVRESTSKPSSTRKHVICDCNICQGAEVDPRTKESHMKKREISRVFTDRTPERPSEIGTSLCMIVYWILKYQERYRLSDVATNLLIKFIRYLLISHDKNTYLTFPTSLYMARKLFGIGDQIIKYATCPT